MQALIIIEANGKAAAWARITRSLGMSARVIATTGHVCHFPSNLFPIGIELAPGRPLEARRRADPERRERILAAVAAEPPGSAILLAMDDDVEGDVIAFDVADMIYKTHPARAATMFRVRPGPITIRGVRHGLATARPVIAALGQMTTDAIPGRARAVTDRWIGATFSRMAGVPVGRVRSAILGAVHMVNQAPQHLRGRPETGEITFQARSASGGRPFTARVPLTGAEPPAQVAALLRIARDWSGRILPGTVRSLQPAGAAIAPRIGSVRPYNTAEALVSASRHHGIPVKMAMQGLQDSYLRGLISYPRTDSREMSNESAARVTMLGFGCGLPGLDAEVLSSEGRLSSIERAAGGHDGAHEALHPVVGISSANTREMTELVRRPLNTPEGGWDRASVMEAMTILVSRRAFEAAREITLERGNWAPDNHSRISPEDAEILRDLDWVRDVGFSFPWTRHLLTSIKVWPTDSVILETMAIEGIGRPSTYASHVEVAMASGDIWQPPFPSPPRPTPQGINTLKRTPQSVWKPAICRMIEDALENAGNRLGEDVTAPLPHRARHRVLAWLKRVPEEMRKPLLEALKEGRNDGLAGLINRARPEAAVEIDLSEGAPEISTEIPEPSPFGG